ncbi:MAG: UDP-N-acetylglucosamine 1-carboxyvinyltransferase [Chlamydiae bacterium RIFCSPHIGHO2_02_FULL_49_29]|nr:MAG: UDP-N-acetylglucosamine 1-carboxyvinyltransferase [Chlamydiae bacterium RIFCSPHIGHO2_02_FULL_49_29]
MELLEITGGTPLKGRVKAAGAKNAATKLLVASLLSDKRCILHNVPDIGDVETTVDLCQEIGSEIHWDRGEGVLEIVTKEIKTSYVPQRFSGSNRIPILMIGALLGRTEEDIMVPTAGGCKIGKRPVNFHLDALTKLGATVEYREMKKEGAYFAQAHKGLKGTVISLPYPSVGATENALLAAVRAKGTTLIENAAMEPEVLDLILFLQKLGALISLEANRVVKVQQATQFYEVQHTVMTDRVEAASFGMAAIGTKGNVFVEGAEHLHLISFLNKVRELGGGFRANREGIEFFYERPLRGGGLLETDVHPGFLTDWQQPFVVLLTQAQGHSVIHETVYENRFGYATTLKEMGADLELFTQCLGPTNCRFAAQNYHHSLIVKGPTPLKGADIAIPDLRAGFAYVLAALIAEGKTRLSNVHFLDRGYERLKEKLSALGAQVSRATPGLSLKTLSEKIPAIK